MNYQFIISISQRELASPMYTLESAVLVFKNRLYILGAGSALQFNAHINNVATVGLPDGSG